VAANGDNGSSNGGKTAWTGLLSEAGKRLMPVLLTAGSLIGFVAFAGGVIVWTRFSAAKVPPDQAVNAVPRDELVSIGSALLLLFGFFGVLALIGAFLVDRGARATPGMARALLFVFLVEAVTTVVVADGLSPMATIAAAELIALPVAAVLWATFTKRYVDLEDDLPTREETERQGRRAYRMFLLEGRPTGRRRRLTRCDPVWIAAIGIAVAIPMVKLEISDTALVVWLTASILLLGAYAALRSLGEAREIRKGIDDERRRVEAAERVGTDRDEDARLHNERPERLVLTGHGALLMLGLLVAAAGLPWWRVGPSWVGVSIAAAAVLTAALWRISALSSRRVVWYGVAVFLSVPLYGTLTAMARNLEDPQVQPMALIRELDGPDEAIQGLYVTEADDRIYFATVATEGCSNDLKSHSGRLEWVPKSEVVAMSVGPLQDVEDAANSALEMAYALTPAVETPGGTRAILDVETSEDEAEKGGAVPPSRRLEDAGPAVRPNFGGGLSLSPEEASPGDTVVLRMSRPNFEHDVEGFGAVRGGRTLRLGGARVDIEKEKALSARGAEWVETEDGQLLKLAKGGPFVKVAEDRLMPASETPDEGDGEDLFLKLIDPSVIAVGAETRIEGGFPLELAGGVLPKLATPGIMVTQRKGTQGGSSVKLRRRPIGQSWHQNRIAFEVPENGATGAVTVECGQLAGQPLLRISRAPTARITAHMEAGGGRIRFDARRSIDESGKVERRWTVGGLPAGSAGQIVKRLPVRLAPYRVRLTVTDRDHEVDTTEIRVLRLPPSFFLFGEEEPERPDVVKLLQRALVGVSAEERPVAIEVDGHADDVGPAARNLDLSLERARSVRDTLLETSKATASATTTAPPPVPVVTRAFGETCPVDPSGGRLRRNRRVEVFILGDEARVATPRGCYAGHVEHSTW
jgi:flagellar motor protein MotB